MKMFPPKQMKAVLLAPLLLATASCQPPSFDLVPELVNGSLVFRAVDPTFWPDGWDMKGVDAHEVTLATQRETLWMTRSHDPDGSCAKLPEHHPFPLVYGRTPRCFRDKVFAKPLPKGVWIRVSSWGTRRSDTFVRITGDRVERREWRDEDAPNEAWNHPDQQDDLGNEAAADVQNQL